MGRLLVLIGLVVVVVWAIKRAFARAERDDAPRAKPAVEGDLVSCTHCGVLLPRTEALPGAGGVFCSEDHARRGPGASPPPR